MGFNVPVKRVTSPKNIMFTKTTQMSPWNRLKMVQQIKKQMNTLNRIINMSKIRLCTCSGLSPNSCSAVKSPER